MSLGDAYIDVHADFDPFEKEVSKGARKAGADADKLMEGIGDKWGDTLADSTSKSLGSHGKDFADSVSKSTRKQIVETHWGYRDASTGRFVKAIEDQAEQAFTRMARAGGPFDTLTTGIQDAIGAGFNVSGKSPLIGVLAIAMGALVGVILAALQAANALVAVLATVPALLTAIGLQAGVLMLAFDGVGKAISGAFAAKNLRELDAALTGLTPAARRFVFYLLPIRDFFRELKKTLQENFFASFGDTLTRVFTSLKEVTGSGMARLATALGTLFRQIGLFFASAEFREFISRVIPATLEWLSRFGPSFTGFLKSLIAIGNTAIPFLTKLGDLINYAMRQFSRWIDERVKDGTMEEWLNSMFRTLQSVSDLFFALVGFVASFLDQLDKAGGQEVIDELTEALRRLGMFIDSPVGKKALEGIINVAIMAIDAFAGLILIVGLVAAGFEFMGEAIAAFLTWFTVDFLGGIGKAWSDFMNAAMKAINSVYKWFHDLPNRIANALYTLGRTLYDAGRNAIRSFGDGIGSMWKWVQDKARSIVQAVTDVLPGSPAKTGPLSGSGYSKLRGERMVTDFMVGMESQSKALQQASVNTISNVFNLGGIRQEFSGALPTNSQAQGLGASAGNGVLGQLARRDVALAVRVI